jgi:hypothetical protein
MGEVMLDDAGRLPAPRTRPRVQHYRRHWGEAPEGESITRSDDPAAITNIKTVVVRVAEPVIIKVRPTDWVDIPPVWYRVKWLT